MEKSTKKLVTNAFIIISPTSALDQKTWLFLDKFHGLLDLFHNAKSWELYSRHTEVMLICQRWLLHWLLRQMYVNRYRFLFPILVGGVSRFCLFDLILYVPVNNISVMSGRVSVG